MPDSTACVKRAETISVPDRQTLAALWRGEQAGFFTTEEALTALALGTWIDAQASHDPTVDEPLRDRVRKRLSASPLAQRPDWRLNPDCQKRVLDAVEKAVGQAPTTLTQPLDVALDPDEQPPERVLGMFYRDQRHLLYGETESLKTWVALAAATEYARAGEHTLWVDLEMTARELARRLHVLGCTTEERARVRRLGPEHALTPENIRQALSEARPALVVLDAITGSLSAMGLDDNLNVHVEQWWREVGNPLWGGDRCLVAIDHDVKAADGRGRFSSGSKRKLEGADVGVRVTVKSRLGRNPPTPGRLAVKVTKDRLGWMDQATGQFVIEPGTGGMLTYGFTPGVSPADALHATKLALLDAIRQAKGGLSKNKLISKIKGTTGSTDSKRAAIDELAAEGKIVCHRRGNADIVTLV